MLLAFILAVSMPTPQPIDHNIDYTPKYSYQIGIAKNKYLADEIKKSTTKKEFKETIILSNPSDFLIDTNQTLNKDDIVTLIRDYSIKYGVDPERSIRIAKCESSFDPKSTSPSGRHFGIFQFLPSTFNANAKRLLNIDPDVFDGKDPSVFDTKQNIIVATWMFSQNQYHQWSCK